MTAKIFLGGLVVQAVQLTAKQRMTRYLARRVPENYLKYRALKQCGLWSRLWRPYNSLFAGLYRCRHFLCLFDLANGTMRNTKSCTKRPMRVGRSAYLKDVRFGEFRMWMRFAARQAPFDHRIQSVV